MDSHKRSPYLILLLLPLFLFILSIVESCKKSHSDIGKLLFDKTKNKIYKQVTDEGYAAAFKAELNDKTIPVRHPEIIKPFYGKQGLAPIYLKDHFANGDIDAALVQFEQAGKHGLDPSLFQTGEIRGLLAKISDKKAITTIDEAYKDMARLELLMANATINYSNALQFGLISPRRIYARYFTKTLRPDSTSMNKALGAKDLKAYLDSIQPKSPQYISLQKALADNYTAPGMTQEETKRILLVNLERLRWKNKPTENRYVLVNIPAFELNLMDDGKSELNMKVCVGEGRNKDYTRNLVEYEDSDKIDRPFSRETPQLNSMIYEAQVNPVWNIPVSIASKEIVVEADKDPYYLSNKGINVYRNGKLVDDPETIDWSGPKVGTEYSFKQQPGDDNSLGKIKFLFPNKSSVYLHDTPAKSAFKAKMRAVSHGCVRLEKPVDFAHALFGDGEQFEAISKYLNTDNPKPVDVDLPKKVPVYITYVTCWTDDSGTLQFRPDVYGLDIVLFGHLQKLLGDAQKSAGQIASL